MDYHKWAPIFEFFRGIICISLILAPINYFLQIETTWFLNFLLIYFIFTAFVGLWAKGKGPDRKLIIN